MTQGCYYCPICAKIHSPVDVYGPVSMRQRYYEYPQIHKDRLFRIMKNDHENNICRTIKVQ